MNVSLTPELEAFVEQAVKSGRYGSASEAVREGLRLLQEREAKFLRLKKDIEDGLASGDAGEFDDKVLERIKTEGRKRLLARQAAE
ncbi:type II toxin-antitoxin system ParD family antitoxin [Caulobacter mirabilis]|uniref:Type II toxin-antitoxin system ParD family antitoxin n=1 Tax=Caulobacter mirabilis TaxID=69666 RepID=A0A2D2AUR3_9CAUL|nr:type II toxin-antitoxin system ParD family antitoxin [Caulobacter mirabilis]ATQ41749.1 type II toxin-antitoxin system ParD family antitoxin [Caulobacter mirabilis]